MQTITLIVILSLLSSILSTALTSDQIYPSYEKELDNTKTKTKELNSKPIDTAKSKEEINIKETSKPTKKSQTSKHADTTPKVPNIINIKDKDGSTSKAKNTTKTSYITTDTTTNKQHY